MAWMEGATFLKRPLKKMSDAAATTKTGIKEYANARFDKEGGTNFVIKNMITKAQACPITLNREERATFWNAATTATNTLTIICIDKKINRSCTVFNTSSW